MSSLAISDVPWISKRIKACCRRAKLFSTDEILLSQPDQLQKALRILPEDTDLLLLQVATAAAPPPVSVLDALNGKLPAKLDDNLFGADANDNDSADDSDNSDAAPFANDARLPGSSIVVPPTQGYDGNYLGADRFVYDSGSDSDSDKGAHSHPDAMMHEDIETPSTFRTRITDHHVVSQDHAGEAFDPSRETAPPLVARDVLSLGRDRYVLTSGANELDDLLQGGFRSAALTEMAGESGSGKTQISIQACTYAALGFVPLPAADQHDPTSLPPLNPEFSERDTLRDLLQGYGMAPWTDAIVSHTGLGACYITSSGERGAHSIIDRALELADYAIRERFERMDALAGPEGSQDALDRHILLARALELGRDQVLRNLHVACVADIEALEHALKYSLPGLISRLSKQQRHIQNQQASPEIGIIVVDNLPSLFQEDPVAGDIDSLVQRSKMLVEIADALKKLSVSDHVSRAAASTDRVVLVLNHVSDAFGVDKEIARRFVFDSADRIRLSRSKGPTTQQQQQQDRVPESVYPDYPMSMEYATQSAYVSGLLASVPPTLAEAIGTNALRSNDGNNNESPLYVLHPRTAQLGHTWSNLINVRLFLSKTRGRVAMPKDSVGLTASEDNNTDGQNRASIEREGAKPIMATVRKAAVVLNPFGPTMLDPTDKTSKRTAARQLRFVITPSCAVHALNPYNVTNPSASLSAGAPVSLSNATRLAPIEVSGPGEGQGVAERAGEEAQEAQEAQEEESVFGDDLELFEESHLLAIDQLEGSWSDPTLSLSFPSTPTRLST